MRYLLSVNSKAFAAWGMGEFEDVKISSLASDKLAEKDRKIPP